MQTDRNGRPDVMRAQFTPITEGNKALAQDIKEAYNNIHSLLTSIANDRHMALALTHLETSCMFAVKSITAEENQK